MIRTLFCLIVLTCCQLASAQNITTIAGNGKAGYEGDNGSAVKASINSPIGVALGKLGQVYIADYANNCVREVSRDGRIRTVAGGKAGNGLLSGPVGVAVAGNGELYIADYGNSRICRLDHARGQLVPVTIKNGAVANPSGLAMDRNDNLYIADQSNNRVCKLHKDGRLEVLASGLRQPSGVAVDYKGRVYASSWSANMVWCIEAGSAGVIAGTGSAGYGGDGGPATVAVLNQPYSIATAPDGNLYITDDANCRIRKLDLHTGIINTIVGKRKRGFGGDGHKASDARINGPAGIIVSEWGDVYFSDENNQRIRRISGVARQ